MPSSFWFSTDPGDIDMDWPGDSQFDVRDFDADGESYMWKVSNGISHQVPSTDDAIRRVIRKALREPRFPL